MSESGKTFQQAYSFAKIRSSFDLQTGEFITIPR
jgi:hypothetical protein